MVEEREKASRRKPFANWVGPEVAERLLMSCYPDASVVIPENGRVRRVFMGYVPETNWNVYVGEAIVSRKDGRHTDWYLHQFSDDEVRGQSALEVVVDTFAKSRRVPGRDLETLMRLALKVII